MTPLLNRSRSNQGFTLIEMLIALGITVVVMASVFQLLHRGQKSFQREPEVAEMTANARAGLAMIGRDLNLAGSEPLPAMSIAWTDGGGIIPDTVTIVYAEPGIPFSEAGCPGAGKSCSLKKSSSIFVDTTTFLPAEHKNDPEQAYHFEQHLSVIEICNPPLNVIPFELTTPPSLSAGELRLNHNPSGDINPPQGFDGDIAPGCGIIGAFHVVQYRVNPIPPAVNPALERREVTLGEPWTPVAANIENLQFQYSQGTELIFRDVPNPLPVANDPETWITGVRITITGRSASTNLSGGTTGVFAAEDTHLRKTFTTSIVLRNQLGSAAIWNEQNDVVGWN